MSPASIQRRRLEFQCRKDGIPTSTPRKPKLSLPSVPSILCMQHRNPILGYSKAPWGLSVLSRVTGIFTGTTISPGGLLRQCPNRYAIRAGQNLPDKEFRYLRTVIVTAAVHWGFNSMLAHLLLTFQHHTLKYYHKGSDRAKATYRNWFLICYKTDFKQKAMVG